VLLVDRFTRRPKYQRPILHISSNTFHQGNASFCDICLSVCHVFHIPFVHLVLKRCRKFILWATPGTSEWWSNFDIKTSKIKVPENENAKTVFALIFVKKMVWFTSNKRRNDHRPILHLSSDTFYQQKCISSLNRGCKSHVSVKIFAKNYFYLFVFVSSDLKCWPFDLKFALPVTPVLVASPPNEVFMSLRLRFLLNRRRGTDRKTDRLLNAAS